MVDGIADIGGGIGFPYKMINLLFVWLSSIKRRRKRWIQWFERDDIGYFD